MSWTQSEITGNQGNRAERKQQRMTVNEDRETAWRKFGAAVTMRRLELGLERKDVEEKSGGVCKQAWLGDIERGRGGGLTSYELLTRLAFTLDWTPQDLAIQTGMLESDPIEEVP